MRYFGFVLKTDSEQIKGDAKINLRGYAYENPIAAMNQYMYQNMKNGICYFAYREEAEMTLAAFSYDEKEGVFHDAYDYILEMLNAIFCIKKVKEKPHEITMYQFYEYMLEARRRDYFSNWMRIASHVEFEDYSANELCDITRLILSRKQMAITDAAMEKLKNIYESVRSDKDFGNGRFVRKILEEAEMNLAERVAQLDESKITTKLITTIEARDITESDAKKHPNKKPIGFCVA